MKNRDRLCTKHRKNRGIAYIYLLISIYETTYFQVDVGWFMETASIYLSIFMETTYLHVDVGGIMETASIYLSISMETTYLQVDVGWFMETVFIYLSISMETTYLQIDVGWFMETASIYLSISMETTYLQVDVGGFMHFWGLTIDVISCVNLVIAVGLCVDYAAHIVHCFLLQTGFISNFFRCLFLLTNITVLT
jgi:hypothetical protein